MIRQNPNHSIEKKIWKDEKTDENFYSAISSNASATTSVRTYWLLLTILTASLVSGMEERMSKMEMSALKRRKIRLRTSTATRESTVMEVSVSHRSKVQGGKKRGKDKEI